VNGFEIVNGIAEIGDPAIYSNWLDNDEFKAAVAADVSPRCKAVKRGLIEFEADRSRIVPIAGSTPPPVVGAILDGEVGCLMMCELAPDPVAPGAVYEWNIPTVFRVHDGKISEHWSSFRKVVPGRKPGGD
jgi:predicted SnoaL-like aldol condensation-catalyzing enzyme